VIGVSLRRGGRALALALLAACAPRLGPESFGAAIEPLPPPPAYATWYAELLACAGGHRPFEAINWYRTRPDVTFVDPRTGEVLAGFWTARREAIILGAAYTDDPAVVKHELLHYLRGRGDHSDANFRAENACGVAAAPPNASVSAVPAR